ncbi:MAG: cobalt-precorrin-7 (C(5))-methyltransferase [Sulfolobales archaeon]
MLYIIGVGPGDPELLTLKGHRILGNCDIIAGWSSVIRRFSKLIAGKEIVEISYLTEARDLEYIADLARSRCVAFLIHGDPSVSDWQLMEKLRKLCRSYGIECEIIPGVSSLNTALSREGLDMAEIIFISLHAEGAERYYEEIIKATSIGREIVVFPEPYRDGPQRVARYLVSKGLKGTVKIYENLTYKDEHVYEYKLEDLAKEEREFSDLCVMILKLQIDPK